MNNNKGSALILVIIVVTVLSVIGISFLIASNAEHNLSIFNERKIQAQNISKSGADAAAKHFMVNPISSTVTVPDTVLGNGSFSVVISRPDLVTMLVRSQGRVGSVVQTVSVLLEEMDYDNLFTGIRQMGTSDLDLGALEITHDPGDQVVIQANVTDLSEIDLGANASDPAIKKVINNTPLPEVELPNLSGFFDDDERALQVDPNSLIGDYDLTTLSKNNVEDLVFYTDDGIQQIVVDTLNISGPQGSVTINGDGEVHLYIRSSGVIDNPVVVNGTNPAILFIYLMEGSTLELQANASLNAYIYGPNATIEIQSDQTNVSGAIIGNVINRGNSNGALGSFHFVPLENDPGYTGIHAYFKSLYTE